MCSNSGTSRKEKADEASHKFRQLSALLLAKVF